MEKYNQNTIIGDKIVNLTNEEKSNVATFHQSRVAFSYLPNNDIVTLINDEREHRVWLKEDYNIDDETFESLIRGYIKDRRIVIYISSNFDSINKSDIPKVIKDISKFVLKYFGNGIYEIWNGVNIGKPGKIWTAKNIPWAVNISSDTLSVSNDYNINIEYYTIECSKK